MCCYFLNWFEENQEFLFHSARPKTDHHKEAQCGTMDSIFSLMFPFIGAFIIPSNTVSTFKKCIVTCDFVEKPE